MYTFMSYFFYLVSAIAGYMAAFDLLVQVFPDYGFIELTTGFFVTLMFFPLVPLYPGIDNGEWLLAIVCYVSIMLGVISGNQARKSKT
jgi:hypothetical protein